ncbi:MAG TPA: [Fe-Fe] hydrogenase large subunit C-terminal domain-containing protein [Clostridia bacterium]|nr:[Fe-Fe] hydrogenase large subunit C-terminal domain-containing protein [Clostridia bacterium]
MEKQGGDFYRRRMELFRELVRLLWNNGSAGDIDALIQRLIKSGRYQKTEEGILKKQIDISMGLDPGRQDTELSADIDAAFNLGRVKKPLVTVLEEVCDICKAGNGEKPCKGSCSHGAADYGAEKGIRIDHDKCLSCGACIPDCPLDAVVDKIEFVPIIKHLKEKKRHVYAIVAPAFVGQFGAGVRAGQVRSALKYMGFRDMIEVALLADLLTLREAYEFEKLVREREDYLITSCCCPIWMNMVRKGYPELLGHFSPAVSPMIATGRVLKELDGEAIVVFIGPCIAKKSEAKDKELEGAVDFVLTFRELEEVFKALELDVAAMADDHKEQSSLGGRIYGRTGGVSSSVEMVVKRLMGEAADFRPVQADGVKACKEILDKLKAGEPDANFIEGMGCKGGCAGGPRSILDIERASEELNGYGEAAVFRNPLDNERIAAIMEKTGIKDAEDIVKGKGYILLGRDI